MKALTARTELTKMNATKMNAIEVRNIVKQFGSFVAVNGLTFDVQAGEIFGLLGPNGAGKSTLIRMLTTLLPPTSGTATVGGFDIGTQPFDVRSSIGVIPQAMTSDLDLSVEENLLIFAKLYGVARLKRPRIIHDLLDAVELLQWADKPVKYLSGGMRRRVEIARGLVSEPSVLFLDEPTTGLDPVSRVAVWEMLKKIKSQRDLTILLTTHYMDEADRLCDRIAIVDHGELKALDSPMKLKASVSTRNLIEVSFATPPPSWEQTLRALPDVDDVEGKDGLFRVSSHDGPRTTMRIMEAAGRAGVPVLSLSVLSTTLDDVFVQCTGHALRDALQAPSAQESPFLVQRG
jgi:ABC-2 type transport system ATP-binding protein